MIKLEKQFTSGEGGYSTDSLTYIQICRTAKVALYQRKYSDGQVKDHEVFRIKILPKGTQVFKTITPDDEEKYPGASQFGFSAWSISCRDPRGAMPKYNELCAQADAKEIEDTTPEPEVTASSVPTEEFTTNEYAAKNGLEYVNAYLAIKAGLANGTIKFVREVRLHAKGKASKVYAKV